MDYQPRDGEGAKRYAAQDELRLRLLLLSRGSRGRLMRRLLTGRCGNCITANDRARRRFLVGAITPRLSQTSTGKVSRIAPVYRGCLWSPHHFLRFAISSSTSSAISAANSRFLSVHHALNPPSI